MLARLPRNAPVWLDRLSTWLEPFEVCFTHVAQRGAFRLSARVAERQSTQVDECDARARQRPRHVSGVSAFHHACAVERGSRVAPAAGAVPERDGLSRHATRGVPPPKPGRHRPPSRLQLTDDRRPEAVRPIAASLPARAWRRVTWRNGMNRPWAAHFAALRVTPAHDSRERRLAPFFERDLGSTPRIKAYLVDLPDTASLPSLARLATTGGRSSSSNKVVLGPDRAERRLRVWNDLSWLDASTPGHLPS